ncbi:MAG: peptidase M23, partial [Dialister invisus]|nr:peptidase M23 [Dialister invisus]
MSAALISAILFGAVTPVAADELNDKLQNLQDQIDESRAKQQSWQEVINEIAGKLRTI